MTLELLLLQCNRACMRKVAAGNQVEAVLASTSGDLRDGYLTLEARLSYVSSWQQIQEQLLSRGILPCKVDTPEGSTVRVEARRADTVRVVKAMIQLKTGP
eukprot:3356879-Amphidinium_carterae.1